MKEPTKCFECGSEDIQCMDYEYDLNTVYMRIECMNCGHEWTDVYEYSRSFDTDGNIIQEEEK